MVESERIMLISDSICVKILSTDKIIAGLGNELRFYQEAGDGRGAVLEWKLKGKIHGIDYDKKDKILINGEKEFMILSYNNNNFNLICKSKISDWISSAKFLNDCHNEILLVSSHSVALGIEYNLEGTCLTKYKQSCVDKSTLYCSHILGTTWDNATIFGGTAFGEVIIWQPNSCDIDKDSKKYSQILHRIPGHQGVIFSIDINTDLNLMTTTSDDRSVRFWIVDVKKTTSNEIDWKRTILTPKKSGYSHTARVFRSKIIKEDDKIFVISVGEDSYICIWNKNCELLFKRRQHFGATIWNLDYDYTTKTIFTTSNDGNIIKYNLSKIFKQKNDLIEIPTELFQSEYLAKIKFLKTNYIIGITNKNNLLIRSKNNTWNIINEFNSYKCTTLEVFDNIIAIAGYKILTLYEFCLKTEKLIEIFNGEILNDIIRSFCFLSRTEYLICDNKGDCKFTSNNFLTTSKIEIPNSKEKWITSALKIDNHLILSNRQGNLYLYYFKENLFQLKSTIKHVHGFLGVTNMLRLERNDWFQTCGHDNTIKTIKLNKTEHSIKILYTENVPISWIEKVYKSNNSNTFILGFNDNHFILWSTNYDILYQIPCGGGHRCWDFQLDYEKNQIKLIYIKSKRLFHIETVLFNNNLSKLNINKISWHIKSCNILKSFQLNNSSFLLFSGGEDNLLKSFIYSENQLKFLSNMFLHISSIKTIAIKKLSNENLIIFSAGGRAQICVTKYNLNDYHLEEITNFMLKSTDFDRKYQRNTQEIDFDPETRIMNIEIIKLNDKYEIFIGCSDGYIRKYDFIENSLKFIDELFYNKCILHIRIIKNLLIAASTDGFICFWNLITFSKQSSTLFKLKHHDSGINSIDVKIIDKFLYIITGGDDQNICITKLNYENNFQIIFTKKFDFLHSAQVNGVRISSCDKYFYSTGIDQKIYKINLNNFNIEKEIFTCISDIKGIEIVQNNNENTNFCIVYGAGLEICEL